MPSYTAGSEQMDPIFQSTLKLMETLHSTLPPAPRVDGTAFFDDVCCKVNLDYRVDDYGSADEGARVSVVAVHVDFGGRSEANISLSCIPGEKLREWEGLIAADVEADTDAHCQSLRAGK